MLNRGDWVLIGLCRAGCPKDVAVFRLLNPKATEPAPNDSLDLREAAEVIETASWDAGLLVGQIVRVTAVTSHRYPLSVRNQDTYGIKRTVPVFEIALVANPEKETVPA